MTTAELKQILDVHAKWIRGEVGGIRANFRGVILYGANLRGANLSEANLYGANLRGANLSGANLSKAILYGANLSGADLSGADLRGANLYGAILYGANLSEAILRGANLSGADLRGADLSGADLSKADLSSADLRGANLSKANLRGSNLSGAKDIIYILSQSSILPESGPIWGWKKCKDGVLVKLVVGNTAKRSHAAGRKCRAEHVKVLEVIGAEVGISSYDNKTEYRVGQIVRCNKWDENRWAECGGGIHFFLTRIEAERYCL